MTKSSNVEISNQNVWAKSRPNSNGVEIAQSILKLEKGAEIPFTRSGIIKKRVESYTKKTRLRRNLAEWRLLIIGYWTVSRPDLKLVSHLSQRCMGTLWPFCHDFLECRYFPRVICIFSTCDKKCGNLSGFCESNTLNRHWHAQCWWSFSRSVNFE